jgi:hypothetical protein
MTRSCCLLAALLLLGCNGPESAHAEPLPRAAPSSHHTPTRRERAPVDAIPAHTSAYPWHDDASIEPLNAIDSLQARFAPPPGHERVTLAKHSFGAWLRTLPLAASDQPVRANDGRVIVEAGDRYLAAVSTLDVGKHDLQQCADAIMRLHAEWLWSRGRAHDASYPTGATPIGWTRYLRGEIPHPKGRSFRWDERGKQPNTHASYRRYLDVVFSWANTGSLALRSGKPSRADVRPGDFFVLPGSPGHAVLLLDIAHDGQGRRVALIGQSFMPAQSFQVLRPNADQSWFELEDGGVDTPYWRRFPWTSLRRLDATDLAKAPTNARSELRPR